MQCATCFFIKKFKKTLTNHKKGSIIVLVT